MKLILTLLLLVFVGLCTGIMAYIGLKTGVLLNQLGRVAAKRESSALIFWTLWIILALASVANLGGALFIIGLHLRG